MELLYLGKIGWGLDQQFQKILLHAEMSKKTTHKKR